MPRPSANLRSTSWSCDFIESIGCRGNDLDIEVKDNVVGSRKMEEEVRCMIDDEGIDPLALLELIDDIRRLGLAYKFNESINRALERIMLVQSSHDFEEKVLKKLNPCALYFRLLRQNYYQVSTDVFEKFKGSNGKFRASLADDVEGMLSLYEASHLAFEGETTLLEAREFTNFHLKEKIIDDYDMNIAKRLSHALEFPAHHRMQRLEARLNIEIYDNKKNEKKQLLHTLAKLDFNMVQLAHQAELKEVSRWWRHVGLAKKLSFARDRLPESFFCAVGIVFEPKYSKCRKELTKIINLIILLDDIYDVYGSPQELKQLTCAVHKWDINEVNNLPADYMKLFFFALHNTVNEMAYDTLKEQGEVIIPHLRKVWADLCKSFLREAEWSHTKHIPKFDDYINNGWVSSSGVVLLTHAYFLITQNITQQTIQTFIADTNTNTNTNALLLLRFPCTIFRLANDLSSPKEDIEIREFAKAVSCYMHENGVSYEVARAHLRKLIDENWRMMNKEMASNSTFEKRFIETSTNLARTVMCLYQYGDACSSPTDLSRDMIKSIIVDPVQFIDT